MLGGPPPPRGGGGRAPPPPPPPPALFFDAVREIAQACGSTGWTASVLGVHAWHLALYAPKAQAEVWGDNGEKAATRICSSYAPTGEVTVVKGGFRISGRWRFSSGCDHCQWALLGGLVTNAEGVPVDMRTFLIPCSEYAIEDVWDTIGLRGTGSNDIVVDNVFVPEHRALSFGPVTALDVPGHVVNPEPLYRLPYAAIFTTSISTSIAGIAQAAYDAYLTSVRERFTCSHGQKVEEDPFAHMRIGRAGSDIDASWLLLRRNITDLYALAQRGEEPPMALRARTRRDQVLATERCSVAVDLLMENSGGDAMRTGPHPVQRAWRDLHTGRAHAANDPERALVMFGQTGLGLRVDDPML
ncbi:3-hydroxy-9,10-secoandrosta-1,3,5(10)-triene-9,17-dione monooxygenase oxygenase subunit [Streptomyces sp. NPDC050145]|uniref:3-hydroxy-9,10-secoandrosta-1,3,5(10)-triene-9, 17-dione monooxygenase oxygenase subunit n=1 Tax=Streptomyces sp. NPDC050145 TaxID=3365602 RepID=UPI00378B8E4B